MHSCLKSDLAGTGGGINLQEELIQLLHDCMPSAKGLLASAAEQLQGAPGKDPDHPHISADGISPPTLRYNAQYLMSAR